eukprot:COSAG05_NODE_11720_length_500_cov_0.885287_1_plen_93_part_01
MELALQSQEMAVPNGQAIINEGDAADGVYVIVAGTAVVDVAAFGKQIASYKAGEAFGELGVLSTTAVKSGKRKATVRASSDGTRVAHVSNEVL